MGSKKIFHGPVADYEPYVLVQSRSQKMSMVVDLDNTYRPYHAIQIIPKTIFLNSHNSVTFQAMIPKFCMVVSLNNTNRPYHVIV